MEAWLGAAAGLMVGPAAGSMTTWLPAGAGQPRRWWLGAGAPSRRLLSITLACGLVCGLLAWRMGAAWVTPAYVGAGAAGVVLAVIDAEFLLLPNKIMWPLYGWVAAWMAIDAVASGHTSALVRAVLAGGSMGLGGLALAFAFPERFGLGDCKLLGILGALTGWLSWYVAWAGLCLGLLVGVVWGFGLVVARRKTRGSAFPLGPSLLLGALIGIMITGG